MWYHLVGISGVSMRTIAKILKNNGHKVTGSDLKIAGHSEKNISKNIDAVVYTSAVTPNSPGWVEIKTAQKMGIKLIKRGEILAKLVEDRKIIAVSGTHGKTTTTAMIGLSLIKAGIDPLVIVGEEVSEINGTVKIGRGKWAVVEACEYDKNFLFIKPDIAVITNIEEEHLDHYPGGISELIDTFTKFVSGARTKQVIICGDDKNASKVKENLKGKTKVKVITYGLKKSNDCRDLPFDLELPGNHNCQNALAAIAVCKILGINIEIVKKALENFRGAKRRFEIKGEKNGALVIDDYGHHPTEITALLSGVSEKYPERKIIAIFWPHQYKRTKVFLKKFPRAFKLADKVIIKEIFFVPGRDERLNISGKDIVNLINKEKDKKAIFLNDDNKIIHYLESNVSKGDIIITIGIPPVYKIGENYLSQK